MKAAKMALRCGRSSRFWGRSRPACQRLVMRSHTAAGATVWLPWLPGCALSSSAVRPWQDFEELPFQCVGARALARSAFEEVAG